MGLPVKFSPHSFDFGVVAANGHHTGEVTISNTPPSASVTAEITNDTSGGLFTIISLTIFDVERDDQNHPLGLTQIDQSDGSTPLSVEKDQLLLARVNFTAPANPTTDSFRANLLIIGQGWNVVSVQMTAMVGQVVTTLIDTSITIPQGESGELNLSVQSLVGPGTFVSYELATSLPGITLTSSPVEVPKGTKVPATLTFNVALSVPVGGYSLAIMESAFNNEHRELLISPVTLNVSLRPGLAIDQTIKWELANSSGVQVDDKGDVWHTGCVRDVLVIDSGETIVASDTGGLWQVHAAGSAKPLADLEKPDLWCLAQGPDDAKHVYAGGDGLYETDVSSPFSLMMWKEIPLLDIDGQSMGTVHRIVTLPRSRRIVLTTSNGVYWSEIPKPAPKRGCLSAPLRIFKSIPPIPKLQLEYIFRKVPNLPEGMYFGLAAGPNETVVVAYWGTEALRASIFFGGWHGLLVLQEAAIRDGFQRFVMFATTLASCRNDPSRMYAVSSGDDGFVSTVLRSNDGGRTWDDINVKFEDDPSRNFRKAAGGPQGNNQVRPNNCIAAAHNDPDKVAIGWRHEGIFISTNGGSTWRLSEGAPHMHADLRTVYFDPTDDGANSIFVGSDGGLVLTRDMGGSYESSFNKNLPILQFQSYPRKSVFWEGSFSISSKEAGRIGGGLQDNGNVSCMAQGKVTPWRNFARDDDGLFTQFIETGHVLYYFNDDSSLQDAALDPNGKRISHDSVFLTTNPSQLALVQNLIIDRVRTPRFSNRQGQLMYAVGVRDTAVYGFFSNADGKNGHLEVLADFGFDFSSFSAVGSLNGTSVYVGSSDGSLFELHTGTRNVTEFGVGLTAKPGGRITRIAAMTEDIVFALYNVGHNGYVLQKQQVGFGQMGNGLPDAEPFYGMEGIQNGERVSLLVASDSRIYVTRDNGTSWENASSGLPKRPHCADLQYVKQRDGNAFLYLSTCGRSVWVSHL